MSEALLISIALLDTACLLVMTVYFIITLSDLECDYLNASECCSRMNKWVNPELFAVCGVEILLLFSGHWVLFLMNLPISIYLINRRLGMSAGNIGVYDPTEIHNRGLLKRHMKEAMLKLGCHIINFFLFLYCFIYALVSKTSSDSS